MEYECEFGSAFPVNFVGRSQVKCYDSEGTEIEIPSCSNCGAAKAQLIGKEAFAWVRICGCTKGE